MKKHIAGKRGEDIAASFLNSQGYDIVERNFRSGHHEIDLIGEKNGELVFVEVKMRSSSHFGYGEEAVTAKKRKYLMAAAAEYLRQHEKGKKWRFDIVAIEVGKEGEVRNIEHIKDVFF